MKKIYPLHYLLILIVSICSATLLQAQNFNLIDINKTKSSDPQNYQYAQTSKFAVLNGSFYFAADDGIHGISLFKSDGTGGGTQLVKDIYPGIAFLAIYDIIASGNRLYFIVSDSVFRQSVWVSDGTEAGTAPLNNLILAKGNSNLSFLTDVNGTIYFDYAYYDFSVYHNELWKTDLAGTGAVLITKLNGFVVQMVGVNDKLFFSYYSYDFNTGIELYTSDGTAEGTTIVADINSNPSTGSNADHLTALNGLLYFAADDGTGNKLWVSDGTASGTHAVKNKNNIVLASDLRYGFDPFPVKNNTLLFQGNFFDKTTSTLTGFELCKYNSSDTAHSVRLIRDIIPGENGSYPKNITNVNGTVFFTVGSLTADNQLWKSDGTKAGTVLLKEFNPGGTNIFFDFINANGTLLFSYGSDKSGAELWKSDGTSEGTILVKDIYPGFGGSHPAYLTAFKKLAFFSATSPKGTELWRTDGNKKGTDLVKNINTTTTYSSYAYGFTPVKNKVVFTANNSKGSGSVFSSDGTAKGTKSLDSIANARFMYNTQQQFTLFKQEGYFADYNNKIWKTNGTKAGTKEVLLPEIINKDSGFITNLVAAEKVLYIIVFNSKGNRTEIWRTDGTAAATFVLKTDIYASFNLSPAVVDNILYFANFGNSTGSELWKTDGTIEGTVLVKTIESNNYNSLSSLYNFKGKLYFSAYTTTSNNSGPSFWTSDGTEAGTVMVKDASLLNQPFAQANGKLFFYAFDNLSNTGYELYVSDGTPAGTTIVKDINPGDRSSNSTLAPSPLVSGEGIIYFAANDGINGTELWKSDGTSAGTSLVKDITPGANGTNFTYAVSSHDQLFFVINNDQLWESDGSEANTNMINDENLVGVSQITNLTATGSRLYFSGYSYATGNELYSGNISFNKKVLSNVSALRPYYSDTKINSSTSLHLKLSPDPARNTLQVCVSNLKQNTPSTISIISSSGAVLKTLRSNSLDHVLQLDISSLANGVYTIKVESAGNFLYSHFVKL